MSVASFSSEGRSGDPQRTDSYNATVDDVRRLHEDLMILRVRPDSPLPGIEAGQYTTLGLGSWEPRVAGCQQEEVRDNVRPKLIKRAYSVSCPVLNSSGALAGIDNRLLEFYIALVRKADRAPALTPRLFGLQAGNRIFCGTHPHGHYSVKHVPSHCNVVFASTGTGEAPHNAMLVELLTRDSNELSQPVDGRRLQGQIAAINCVRHQNDLGYLAAHRALERMTSNYQYIALTTREPENVDPDHPGFVGKRYIQQYFDSGDFTTETGIPLDPRNTHVFLCGNPDMIGLPVHDKPAAAATAVLLDRGFKIDRPHEPGNIHVEQYW